MYHGKRSTSLMKYSLLYIFFIVLTQNANSQTAIDASSVLPLLDRVNLQMDMGNYQQALEIVNSIIEQGVSDVALEAELYWGKSFILFRIGNLQEALNNILRSIELNAHDADSYEHLAIIYTEMGLQLQALQAINRAIELDSQILSFYSNRALIYIRMHEFERALKDVNYILSINPRFANALLAKASIFGNLGNFHDALLYADMAISINSTDSNFFSMRGGDTLRAQQ